MALTAAVIGLATVTVASTVVSTINANKARASQQKLQQLRTNQSRRQQIREARIRRGRVANIAAQTGAQGSSAELGARGSIQTQLAVNLSFLDQSLGIAQQISSQQSRAQTFSGIASLSATGFSALGGGTVVKDLVKG